MKPLTTGNTEGRADLEIRPSGQEENADQGSGGTQPIKVAGTRSRWLAPRSAWPGSRFFRGFYPSVAGARKFVTTKATGENSRPSSTTTPRPLSVTAFVLNVPRGCIREWSKVPESRFMDPGRRGAGRRRASDLKRVAPIPASIPASSATSRKSATRWAAVWHFPGWVAPSFRHWGSSPCSPAGMS